ncbi:non-hydrolyzing UDP-N-acetylglucosamine 2-epimerase [Paenibacillus ginsengarvi]|uniref:UDP-N-acetylglucosamine 2-epimerase (non-hydrolyzing) n=1 Tax=Paenibacillus ginsengarvi TaxID=400777 RepID=A0A3B0C4G4_9BACL|nr:UDP-N-acetylglucosamine 2-epimerase (non-hydrolyzing) [Paenibacillus ginsengarvi]RKN78827.1 UDP-N-acetylglucosamine 2-epimerase (non-hydrolyzing) [Paenibacillus ginsengarvi]
MSRIRVMTIFGTRPEAIKMAPLVLELNKRSEQIESIVCVTGQHREMLDTVLNVFDIKPDYDLNVMKARQTLNEITVRVLQGLEPVLKEAKPDIVLVHGDTITSFLASFAGFMQKIAIGHVEAGLRTWNKYSPYPEEMNRQLTGVLADMHFAPTDWSADNLRRENKSESTIYVTGNTITDCMNYLVKEDYTHPMLDWAKGRRLVLVTAHRSESLGEPHRRVFRAIKRIADEFDDIAIVYPVHLNPAVQEPAREILGGHERIRLIDPLDVTDLYNFYPHTHLIMTDSGGIQEEAPSFGVPALVLRDTTERPEGVGTGVLELVGTDEELIYERAKTLLSDKAAYEKMSKAANPYGDGRASARIVDAILHRFGACDTPPEPYKM